MSEDMEGSPHYDVALWQTHATEEDCSLVIRTDNGRAFYCEISPSQFHRSPVAKEQYFKCLNVLRSGEEGEDDELYVEDACEWLSKPFGPLIARLAPCTLNRPSNELPTLAQYLLAPSFACSLVVTDEKLHAHETVSRDLGWDNPMLRADNDLLDDIDGWTRSYHPSEVDICYGNPREALIRSPSQVAVNGGDGDRLLCFFKPFNLSFGPRHARMELMAHKTIAQAQLPPPPEAFVCQLHGVVRDGNRLAGMLFTWINNKGVLSEARAEESTAQLRTRWATQIRGTVGMLHSRSIIWGDVKADNVLIDMDDNAWIIDFGGSYTVGWVDKEKAGTLEGDMQGLAKIMAILS